jgi:Cof subfamily protein (haloacid dehalogenase superfamily)
MVRTIKLVAVDIDGTLFNDHHEITPRVAQAIQGARAQDVLIVPATGRCPSVTQAIMARLGIVAPGVFLQGLLALDVDGTVFYEQTMTAQTVRQVVAFAKERGLTPLIYSGSRIIVEALTYYANLLTPYGEPAPEVIVGPLESAPDQFPVHKMLLLDEPDRIARARLEITPVLDGQASITQALRFAFEILPHGASKGAGLMHLLDALGIPPECTLAIGDGENDIEMLQMAGLGVAMGNAPDQLKAVADAVVATNEQDGVAEALERFVLKG